MGEQTTETAHTDPYCVKHCEPGVRHSQCGCSCSHKRPRLLDLYCCAGGASMGYHRAGFEVFGLDNNQRADYPFPALRGDAIAALDFLLDGRALKWWTRNARGEHVARLLTLGDFAAVVGSPPCQAHTTLTKGNRGRGWMDGHTDLIAATRGRMIATGKPYVIENVVGARAELIDPVMLCGLSFDLRVFRHRLFESNVELTVPAHPSHKGHRVAGWRHGVKHEGDMFAVYGDGGGKGTTAEWQAAMGIDWTEDRACLAEAIPPAYTEHLGRQLIEHIDTEEAAA